MNIVDVLDVVQKNPDSAFFYTPHNFSEGKSVLFKNAVQIVKINSKDELDSGLKRIDDFLNEGLIGYALVAYEFGYILEDKLENLLWDKYDFDLLKFVFFNKEDVEVFDTETLNFSYVSEKINNPNYKIENFTINTAKDKYISDINRVKDYISKGDTYQVNYTVKGKFDFEGDFSDLFLSLVFNQSAEFCTFINNDNDFIVSVSPELFFTNNGLEIKTRPMKGTVKRGINQALDQINKKWLRESEKDQAENVMIVDLLRNDLGRISKFDSVYVESLYDIEQYESLFQMTSTVCSELKENDLCKILKQIFPCGSITGAPKIRTMEIIKELENEPRGIYTGSVGAVSKEANTFNVAIRTVRINKKTFKGEIGIGSGVVWDSIPESEYEETLLKGSFLTNPQKYFELFETILFENESYYLLNYHIKRLKNASDYFLFKFNENQILELLEKTKVNFADNKKYKVKIILNKWGELKVEYSEISEKSYLGNIFINPERLDQNNKFLYHKTTNRIKYNEDYKKYCSLDYDEVIYQNLNGEVTEGSFTNLFIEKSGQLSTPKIKSGLLNGCLREYLLDKKKCIEKTIVLDDLKNADKIFIGNSVRGLIEVKQIWTQNGQLVNF